MGKISKRNDWKKLGSKNIWIIVLSLLVVQEAISQGTFSVRATGNWSVSTTWTLDSGTDADNIPDSDDAVTIDSSFTVSLTAAESCASMTINNVEAAGTAEINLAANILTITGNLQVNDGALNDGTGGGVVRVGGNFTFDTDGNFDQAINGITLNFNGTAGTQTVGGTSAATLTVDSLRKSDNSTVDWNLTGTVELSAPFYLESGTWQAGSATYSLNYSLINGYSFEKTGGTFTPETSTLNVVAGQNTRFSTDANITLYNVRHNPGVARTLAFDETNAAAAVYTIANQFERSSASNGISYLNSASLSYSAGSTLKYSVTSSVNVTSEWPSTGSPQRVDLNTAQIITFDSTRTLDSLIVDGGGEFDVSAAGSLTLDNLLELKSGIVDLNGSFAYSDGSLLKYNAASSYTVGDEWTTTLDPKNVEIAASGATLGAGTFNVGLGSLLTEDGDITFNGTLVHSGTVQVYGDVVGGSGNYGVANNGTLILLGTQDQTINVSETFTVRNLTVNKTTGTATVTDGATLRMDANSTASLLRVQQGTLGFAITATALSLVNGGTHTLQVDNGATLETGGKSITGFSTITASSGTIVFNGTAVETLPTATTIGTLEVDNTAGAVTNTTAGTLTVSNSLVLTDGIITTTSTRSLRLGESATVGGTPDNTQMVVGPLQKAFDGTDPDSLVFPVGSGSIYRPATFNYTASTVFNGSSIVEIEHTTAGFTPKTSPIGPIDEGSHYIVKQLGSAPTTIDYTFTGTFENGNFNPESRNEVLVETTTTYTVATTTGVNESANTARGTGFSAFPVGSNFIVFGDGGASVTWDNGGADNAWFTATNWSGDVVPGSLDNVTISGEATINIAEVSNDTARVATITIGDGTNLVTLTITAGDTLEIHSASSTALTISDNSILVLQQANAILFDPTGTPGYDATMTDFESASIFEYQAGSVEVDTYGNLIVNGSTATTGTGTIIVNGDLTKNNLASTFTPTHSFTVEGTYLQLLGSANFAASTTLTLNGNVNIRDDLFRPSGTTTNFSGSDFKVAGDGRVSPLGTITFTGTSAQTITDSSSIALTFNDLTINKSTNDVTLNDPVSIDIDGSLTLTDGDIITTFTNLLTISNTSASAVSGGGTDSHINGPMAWDVASTSEYIFPLGNGTIWRRLRLTPDVITGETFTVRFFNTDPQAVFGSGLTGELLRVSQVRYWTATRSGTVDAQVKLYWEDVTDGVGSTLSTLRVARFETTGSVWTTQGNAATSGNSTAGTVLSAIVTDFETDSAFTLGSINTIDHSLPVQLSSFEAEATYSEMTLFWTTASELQNEGYNIYRKDLDLDTDWKRLNASLIPGRGNTAEETKYEFIDETALAGHIYQYELESVSYAGVRVLEKMIEVLMPVPTKYALFNNYPNPFNPVTHLKFQLPENEDINIYIYDIRGNLVTKLVDLQPFVPGEHVVQWNGTDRFGKNVATGMYIYRFGAGAFTKSGRMLLVK